MAIKEYRHHSRKGTRISDPYLRIGIVVLVLAAVIGVAASALSSGVPNITDATTLNITSSGTVFRMAGTEYVAFLHGMSGATAYIYITKTPVFISQVLNVTLTEGTTVHVNYGASSANMALTLKSVGTSAYVQIVPISASIGMAPDSAYIRALPPASLEGKATTIKINVNNATSTTTVSAIVTTVPSATSQVMQELQATEYYPLMLNYSNAYAKTLQCTQSMYDADYISQYGTVPTGPSTYQNSTAAAPYNMSLSIAQSSGDIYTATYTTKAKESVGSGPALVITINSTSGAISGTKYEGVFSGLNYTQLYNAYAKMASVGDACESYFG